MYISRIVISLLAAVATSAVMTLVVPPAYAQDAPEFTGPRVEATVGLDQLRFDLRDIGGAGRSKASDLGYGVAIGYDMALSPYLFAGVEGGLNLSDVDAAAGGGTNSGYLRKRREITAAGRIGMAITPTALLYGKLGYANLEVRQERTVAGSSTDVKRHLDGVLLGVGAEVKISRAAYLKGEYRYTDYSGGYIGNKVLTGIGIRF